MKILASLCRFNQLPSIFQPAISECKPPWIITKLFCPKLPDQVHWTCFINASSGYGHLARIEISNCLLNNKYSMLHRGQWTGRGHHITWCKHVWKDFVVMHGKQPMITYCPTRIIRVVEKKKTRFDHLGSLYSPRLPSHNDLTKSRVQN